MGLVCPSTNSYRRLVRGYEAPIAIAFATGNRSGAIRIPGYAKDPESRRFEFRSGDSTSNVYLMFASLLMAGLDGVRNRIDPMKGGFGPLEKNIYEQADGIRLLPANLDEALDELEKDHSFLTEGGVFTDHFLSHWIRVKREEAVEVNARVTGKEYELYYNC
jgi:glutamine synthetase